MSAVRGSALAAACAAIAAMTAATAASASERAARALAESGAPGAELSAAPRLAVPGGGAIYRYRQRAGGLPVFGAETAIADPAGQAPRVVSDSTVAGIGAVDRARAIMRTEAIDAALAATGSERLRGRARARLGIDPDRARLVWEVSLPSRRPLADFLVTVDARGGEALRSRDLLWRASASAALFDPNPVTTQAGFTGLRDAKDRNSALLTGLRLPVILPRIASPRGCLEGRFVDARLGKRAKSVCDRDLDFTGVTRKADRFEALMSYFHVDRTRAYVEGLGLTEGLRRKPQRVRANGIEQDNSYYSPLSRSMTLGTGGVDDAEDADVIVHEYGHSLQDQAVPGFGRSLGAGSMGEGFGDYLAAAMSAQITGGVPGFDACIFDWDAVSYAPGRCGRRADRELNLGRAKRRCAQEIHCLGEVWSSALYELRGALGADAAGRSVMDRVVLESHFMLGKGAGFGDGARALLAADELLYAGAHAAAIEAEMIARELCKPRGC